MKFAISLITRHHFIQKYEIEEKCCSVIFLRKIHLVLKLVKTLLLILVLRPKNQLLINYAMTPRGYSVRVNVILMLFFVFDCENEDNDDSENHVCFAEKSKFDRNKTSFKNLTR